MSRLVYTGYISTVVALGGFLLGFDFSVISGVLPFVDDYFGLTESQLGFAAANVSYGAVFGTLVSGPALKVLGRKRILVACAVMYIVSAVLSAIATDLVLFNASRILGGVAIGAAIITAPVYIAEVAPAAYRGRLVGINQFTIVFGISIAYFSNYALLQVGENNWRWMLGVEAVPALLYLLLMLRVPESPRWLVMKGRLADARAVVTTLVGSENAERQVRRIGDSLTVAAEPFVYRTLFRGRLRALMTIAILLGLCQQMSGVNAVFSYAPMIFERAGAGTSAAFVSAAVVGVINLVATVVAVALMDRFGRRPLLIAGAAGMTVAHTILWVSAYAGHFKGPIVLLAILLFIASFAASVGPGYWIVVSEILPNQVRDVGISIVQAATSFASIWVVQLFPWELATLGIAGTFGIYSVVTLLTAAFVYRFVPETRGKSLEVIEADLAFTGRPPLR